MLLQIERFAVALALDLKCFHVEFGDFKLAAYQVWLDREQEQQFVEEVEQESFDVVAGRLDLIALLYVDRFDFGHVAEHGEAALFEGFGECCSPGVQSGMQMKGN